jgi:hypothetical protein
VRVVGSHCHYYLYTKSKDERGEGEALLLREGDTSWTTFPFPMVITSYHGLCLHIFTVDQSRTLCFAVSRWLVSHRPALTERHLPYHCLRTVEDVGRMCHLCHPNGRLPFINFKFSTQWQQQMSCFHFPGAMCKACCRSRTHKFSPKQNCLQYICRQYYSVPVT